MVVVAALVLVGVVLRFWTTSDLWLDEALTVDIARQPLSQLHHLLLHDGAPPLFYVLLHWWMGWFGSSDLAVRSLPGLLSVATMPFVWVAGRRLGGRMVAAAALVLVATSPFAVRYATETRMYSLVGLLAAAGIVALQRVLDRPRPGNLVATGGCAALLLYSHYWAVYLVGVTGLWLAWRAWRGSPGQRRPARAAFAAVALGSLTFVPWLPTFVSQARHTGTPWAAHATFADMVNAITSFAGGPTTQGRGLALIYFALAGIGLFGAARGARHIDLDLRTRRPARPMAVVVVGALAAAVVGGYVSGSTFQVRYAMVVFVPLALLVALGTAAFADRRVRAGVLAAAVIFGLAGSFPDVTTNRTQAGQVAATLARLGHTGDVVAYCPDQLGPAVNRLLPRHRYRQVTFPRGTGPEFVDWVDYARVVGAGNPSSFARSLEAAAGTSHQIWLVWMWGYQTYGSKCAQIETDLLADPRFGAHEQFAPGPQFEPMELVRFAPAA